MSLYLRGAERFSASTDPSLLPSTRPGFHRSAYAQGERLSLGRQHSPRTVIALLLLVLARRQQQNQLSNQRAESTRLKIGSVLHLYQRLMKQRLHVAGGRVVVYG